VVLPLDIFVRLLSSAQGIVKRKQTENTMKIGKTKDEFKKHLTWWSTYHTNVPFPDFPVSLAL